MADSKPKPQPVRVLFLCTGNACRSQMAEWILRHYGGDRFEVHSAGSHPAGVHPLTIVALDEIGVHAGEAESKHWSVFQEEPPFDYVITVCDAAAERCPIFPGQGKRLHWSLDDPPSFIGSERERMAEFRRVRDEIAGRIRRFINRIASGQPAD